MTHDQKQLGRSRAKSAASGAVVAIPLPVVGPPPGAIAGAGHASPKAKKRA